MLRSASYRIAIGGYPGAFKSTIAATLERSFGYSLVSASQVLRNRAEEVGFIQDGSRDGLMPLWYAQAEQHGRDWLAKSALEFFGEQTGVFDGLRIVEDAELFIGVGGQVWFVDVTPEQMLARLGSRGRSDDAEIATLDDVYTRIATENANTPFDQLAIRAMATHIIGPLEDIEGTQLREAYFTKVIEAVLLH